jgi:hypothetical protein
MTDLPDWFKSRPQWLQEATKRLVEKGSLEDSDYADLVSLCKKEAENQVIEVNWDFPENRFTSPHFDSLFLLSIGEVEGINALGPREPLNFGKKNLSVVYGANGSGKSGYVRILKHVCGAKEPGSLLPNVFSPGEQVQKCSIGFTVNEEDRSRSWTIQDGIVPDLEYVDIFDAATGRFLIDRENEVFYEPPILSFFSDLISVCERVSQDLDSEERGLTSTKPTLPSEWSESPGGIWYSKLSNQTTREEVETNCKWEDADETKMTELGNRLNEPSPASKGIQLRSQKRFSEELIQEVCDLLEKLSDGEFKRIQELTNELELKRRAADAAAKNLFAESPLQGVGSDVWRLLWDAAKKYSEEVAYVGIEFPNTDGDARCVLCQQVLLTEGRNRLRSFEDFVKGETQRAADQVSKELEKAIQAIGNVPTQDSLTSRIAASKLF